MSEPLPQLLIRAGVPGKPGLSVKHGKPYPSTTTDMAKIFAEMGYAVVFEDERSERAYVSLYAADMWLPIVQVAATVLEAGAGNLLSESIIRLLAGRAEDAILHVEYQVEDSDGRLRAFKASGKGADVLAAITRFEEKQRER